MKSFLLPPPRAVLFDFDGLIADTESLHFETFTRVLAEENISLPESIDGRDFLGIHDRMSFENAFSMAGRILSEEHRDRLVDRKSLYYTEGIAGVRLLSRPCRTRRTEHWDARRDCKGLSKAR